MSDSFDYIIVGSGAAGSVVAARLAEANAGSVCVIEAGGDNDRLMVNVPAGFVHNLRKPDMMWQFESVAGDNTAGRSVYLPQGKIAGGSTSINGLIYNRGQAQDFDHWGSLGNPGWSYKEVLPYFRKAETREGVNSQYRGGTGPLRISDPDQAHDLCDRFIDSVAEHSGAPKHNDYNAESQFGTGYYQRFIHRSRRENVAGRYLKPALKNSNVSIRYHSHVNRVLFEQGRAVGIEVERHGQTTKLSANKEVLLCAGTVNSASLLQRSGVGDGDYLQSLGIPVEHHLPGVGSNFQDHYFVRLAVRLRDGTDSLNSQARGWRLGREIVRWMMGKPSILAWSPSIAYAFLHAETVLNGEDASQVQPDLQFVFSHGSYRPGRVYELDTFPAVTCGFTQQRPYSSGYVRIRSADVHDKPEVQPNYLVDERDQQIAVNGVKLARRFLQSTQFQSSYVQEEAPGDAIQTDEAILQYARETGNTGYHLVGTCKMGPSSDAMAVVSPELRLHGMEGIRVIDASVMPTVTSSNTCAATIMIGEKGADMLLNPGS
jgi:choline dehydrogenase